MLRPVLKAVRSVTFTRMVYAVSRNRRVPLVRALSWLACAVLKASENCSFDMRLNGERKILSLLSKAYRFDTILDVGANHGEWTAMALEEFPGATFHCFEIAPPVFSILARNMPKSSKINLNAFGLADRDERIKINFSADDDGLTSLLTPLDEGSPVSVIEADIRTGDGYLATKGLRAVDYLKVDVEGAEPLVFAGFEEAFRSRRFRCVQFEYGHSDTSLREYYRFFEEHGYRVGKIFPDGCDFGGYTSRRELVASNYIAVRSDEQEIIDTLDSRLRSAGRQTMATDAVLTVNSDELRGLAVKSGGRSTN